MIAGTPGASILPEIDVQAADHLLVKRRYSAFFGTGLDDLLARLNCSRLIIGGINTHAYVRTTVADAYQRNYEIILAILERLAQSRDRQRQFRLNTNSDLAEFLMILEGEASAEAGQRLR